jgi:hypothetical protein
MARWRRAPMIAKQTGPKHANARFAVNQCSRDARRVWKSAAAS